MSQYSSEYARQELGGEFLTLGAGMIKRDWFEIVDAPPPGLRWARYWDLATSERTTADYTVGGAGAFGPGGILWLRDFHRAKMTWPVARHRILDVMTKEEQVLVGIESAGFQLAAWQDLMTHPITMQREVRPISVDRDKIERAQPWIARAEQRRVKLVRGAWNEDFFDEVENFPVGRYDDQVDTVSGINRMLALLLIPLVLPEQFDKESLWIPS